MNDIPAFMEYAVAFEHVLATGDWSLLDRHFTEDAVHVTVGGGPLSCDNLGREAVIAGLRRGVEMLDHRFDRRLPEVTAGPEMRDGAVWMQWRMTLERDGLPSLVLTGDHRTMHRDGRIARLDEKLGDGVAARIEEYLARYDDRLKPPVSTDPLSRERMQALVEGYARAKSRADVPAALSYCHENFELETIPFRLTARGSAEARDQLGVFFQAFPDYAVRLDAIAFSEDALACWGQATMSMRGPMLGIPATGRAATLDIFCTFTFRDAKIARERFFFDLAELCAGIGIASDELRTALGLAVARTRTDGPGSMDTNVAAAPA